QKDTFTVQLAMAPVGTVTVKIAPSDTRVCLTSSDARWNGPVFADPSDCPALGSSYSVTFNSSNWYVPVVIDIYAKNDTEVEDPHNTALIMTIDPSTTDAAYNAASSRIQTRIDALVIDDETPGVFLLESNGETVVPLCGNNACTIGGTDDYTMRLTKAP